MIASYHVTIDRQGDEWRAVCPALRRHGAFIGDDTREEALTHIGTAISLILEKMTLDGMLLPSNERAPAGVLLNIMIE